MLFKLAFRNVRKSFSDYTIYFITLMFAVIFFYSFNSLDAQQAVMDLNQNKASAAQLMLESINVFSIFVALTLGILILYANNFLIKRRNKELGVYLTLGMGRGRVSAIFMLETLLVGVIALVVGLLLGVLFSQGMSLITAKMFAVEMKSYVFVFSPKAAIQSIVYFGVVFLCVMVFNAIRVSKQKVIKLLHANVENEKIIGKKTSVSIIMTISGIVLILLAYYLIIIGKLLFYLPYVMLTGIPGTFLLFAGLSGFVFKIASHNKKRYFKGLNPFVTRQITSKINSTHTSMALICIMLFVAITTLGASTGVSAAVNKEAYREIKFDTEYSIKPEASEQAGSGLDALKEYGIPVEEFYRSTAEYKRYISDVDVLLQFDEYLDPAQKENIASSNDAEFLIAVPQSQFNHFLRLIGEDELELSEGELGAVAYNQTMKEKLERFAQDGKKIHSNQKDYTLARKDNIPIVGTRIMGGGAGTSVLLVYPDEALTGFELNDIQLKAIYRDEAQQEELDKAIWEKQEELLENGKEQPFNTFTSIVTSQDYGIGLQVVISFVGIYLGITFLITAAVILALQQLSAANDNRQRYVILRKLGTEEKMVNKSLMKQISIYFLIPLIVAAIHAIFGIKGLMSLVNSMWYENTYQDVVLGLCGIAVIYGIYFLVTCFSSKKIIRENR